MNEKVVWVVGGSSGIGEAIALYYARLGSRIIISGRDREKLSDVREKCLEHCQRVDVIQLDYEQDAMLDDCCDKALALHGHVDYLFLSSGMSQRSLIRDTRKEVYRRLMEVNYFGTITIANRISAAMVKRKSGQIAVISSIAGLIGTPLRSGYAASKGALAIYFECMSAEVHLNNVFITMVYPGYIKTEITRHSLTGNGAPYNKIDERIKSGITAFECARSIVRAVDRKKFEIVVAHPRERIAVWLKRFFPSVLRWIARRENPLG